jgi:hypothetical protein
MPAWQSQGLALHWGPLQLPVPNQAPANGEQHMMSGTYVAFVA